MSRCRLHNFAKAARGVRRTARLLIVQLGKCYIRWTRVHQSYTVPAVHTGERYYCTIVRSGICGLYHTSLNPLKDCGPFWGTKQFNSKCFVPSTGLQS